MTYQAHACAACAIVTGRCPACGAPRLACALCGLDVSAHDLDPCPAAA